MTIGFMRKPDSRLGRRTVLVALAGGLVLAVSACDQAPTAERAVEGTYMADTSASTQDPGNTPVAARVAVDDKTLATNVKAALMASAALNATTIDVSAEGGIITLSGTTNTKTRRDLAGYLALRVDGVISVRNRIAVISNS